MSLSIHLYNHPSHSVFKVCHVQESLFVSDSSSIFSPCVQSGLEEKETQEHKHPERRKRLCEQKKSPKMLRRCKLQGRPRNKEEMLACWQCGRGVQVGLIKPNRDAEEKKKKKKVAQKQEGYNALV